MSTFFEKLKRRELPGEADWRNHLVEAHRLAPGMTPKAFADLRTTAGLSSYDLILEALPDALPSSPVALDLACGDGYLARRLLQRLGPDAELVGVDMSEAELELARVAVPGPRARFLNARAQELPLIDGAVDVAVSHMALMLMLPIEPVVTELARVLRPGGRLVAVVDGPSPKDRDDVLNLVFARVHTFLMERYPTIDQVRWGDTRLRTKDGLAKLFTPALGFTGQIEVDDFAPAAMVPPEGIWEFVKDTYFVGMLPALEKDLLRREVLSAAAELADGDGMVAFQTPLLRLVAVR